MKVFTVQSYKVVQMLSQEGVFQSKMNTTLAYEKGLKWIHDHIASKLNEIPNVTQEVCNPVFGLSRLKFDGRKLPLNSDTFLKLATESNDFLDNYTNINLLDEESILLELEVPNDLILLVNQIEQNRLLVDEIYSETRNAYNIKELPEGVDLDKIFLLSKDTSITTVALPFINKEWVKSVHKIVSVVQSENGRCTALCRFDSLDSLDNMRVIKGLEYFRGVLKTTNLEGSLNKEIPYLSKVVENDRGSTDWLYTSKFDEKLFREGIVRYLDFPQEVVDMVDLPKDTENVDFIVLNIFCNKVLTMMEMIEEDTMID